MPSRYRRPTYRPGPIDRALVFRQHAATIRGQVDPFGIREASALANEVPPLPATSGEAATDSEVVEAIGESRYERERGSCHDRLLGLVRQAYERITAVDLREKDAVSYYGHVLPPSILQLDLGSVIEQHAAGTCPHGHDPSGDSEHSRRLGVAHDLIEGARDAIERDGWEPGPTDSEMLERLNDWLAMWDLDAIDAGKGPRPSFSALRRKQSERAESLRTAAEEALATLVALAKNPLCVPRSEVPRVIESARLLRNALAPEKPPVVAPAEGAIRKRPPEPNMCPRCGGLDCGESGPCAATPPAEAAPAEREP